MLNTIKTVLKVWRNILLMVIGLYLLSKVPTGGIPMILEAKWGFILCGAVGLFYYLLGLWADKYEEKVYNH